MSTYMGRELELLVQSMICGALLVLVYDGIRIFRIIGKRVKSLDTAVDILFWSAAGLFCGRGGTVERVTDFFQKKSERA